MHFLTENSKVGLVTINANPHYVLATQNLIKDSQEVCDRDAIICIQALVLYSKEAWKLNKDYVVNFTLNKIAEKVTNKFIYVLVIHLILKKIQFICPSLICYLSFFIYSVAELSSWAWKYKLWIHVSAEGQKNEKSWPKVFTEAILGRYRYYLLVQDMSGVELSSDGSC